MNIPAARLEQHPSPLWSVDKHIPERMGYMIYGHKTAGEIVMRVAKTFVALNVNISGNDELKKLAKDVIRWCARDESRGRKISVSLFDDYDESVGEIANRFRTEYNIRACTDQDIRDFVATITHEMVHVEQWVKTSGRVTERKKQKTSV